MNTHPPSKETAVPRRTRRFWMRTEKTESTFVWSGLLPLVALASLMLYALLPFARDDIQAAVHDNTRAALDAEGMQWVQLAVSGQAVELSGTPPAHHKAKGDHGGDADDTDVAHALAVARSVTCPTWAGRFACASSVIDHFPH